MLIIGLTGGIASGKSTVSSMLAEKGAVLIDADRIARELVQPGKPAWQEIVDWQGRSVLQEDGTIDRERLGRLIFGDDQMRCKLNEIIHPKVKAEFILQTEAARSNNPDAVLLYDIPLLIETGMQDLVDLVVLVYVSPGVQLKRLQKRDNLPREEAMRRIRAQMPLESKKKYAFVVINNSSSVKKTARQVDRFWETYVLK